VDGRIVQNYSVGLDLEMLDKSARQADCAEDVGLILRINTFSSIGLDTSSVSIKPALFRRTFRFGDFWIR
jgi:hypothetical protein